MGENAERLPQLEQYCRSYTAGSLEEYLETVSFLNTCIREPGDHVSRLWYRGHEQQYYNLMPSLLRGSGGARGRYGRDHLREDYRYQHFRSKCNQLVSTFPEAKIEWQELMQHHFTKTRLMDWSESSITALLFALEAFLTPGDDRELARRRSSMTPTIWVLDPVRLNSHIYDRFQSRPSLLEEAVPDILPPGATEDLRQSFLAQLKDYLTHGRTAYFEDGGERAVNGIVCLAVLESERQAGGGRLFNLLQRGEFNPFFYLLLRYYGDGLPVGVDELPPLAIVHPYHSMRIQAQHGVFTVMPHYSAERDGDGGQDRRAMEYQPLISDCLCRIRITRPTKIAEELLLIGERRASLYPELEIYAKDIEAASYAI